MNWRMIIATSVAALALMVPLNAQSHPGLLHIHDLRATVTRSASRPQVKVRAYVCLRSESQATKVAPDELRLTQYLIYRRQWRPMRSVTEYDNWVVSLGESWRGPCGWVDFSDDFKWPEGFAGFDSPNNCVGVSFSIKIRKVATKRVAIRCPNA